MTPGLEEEIEGKENEKLLTGGDLNAKMSEKGAIYRGPEKEEVRRTSKDMVSNTENDQLINLVNARLGIMYKL